MWTRTIPTNATYQVLSLSRYLPYLPHFLFANAFFSVDLVFRISIDQNKGVLNLLHIDALVLVEREGQKKILIGTKGERLKRIGQAARIDMERLFEDKVMLRLWVKVRGGWSDDERALRSLGYSE